MRFKSLLVYFVLTLPLGSCFVKKNLKNNDDELISAGYYSYFTDATKQALVYGNYNDALLLYGKCIALLPEKAAPYYQISNIYLSINDIKKGICKESCKC
jgi:hypothetical protein